MTSTIQKLGNGLGIRFPVGLVKNLNLCFGAVVDVQRIGDEVRITPQKNRRTLSAILARITPENLHYENDFGNAVGKEIW